MNKPAPKAAHIREEAVRTVKLSPEVHQASADAAEEGHEAEAKPAYHYALAALDNLLKIAARAKGNR